MLDELQTTLECLQNDADRDVRYFAGGDIDDVFLHRAVVVREHQDSTSLESEYHSAPELPEGETEEETGGRPVAGAS